MANMDYSKADQWIIAEKSFNSQYQGKCEAIMCQGNGYMGLRNTCEEDYLGKKHGFFVSNTFNKCDENEVSELPNIADPVSMAININGYRFSLESGKILKYSKELNLKNGETTRSIVWQVPNMEIVELEFKRFVSMYNKHLIVQQISVSSSNDTILTFTTGINGQITNSGAMHMREGDKRFYDGKYTQLCQKTTQSNIHFVFNSFESFSINAMQQNVDRHINMDRRKLFATSKIKLNAGEKLVLFRISTVHTSNDIELLNHELAYIKSYTLKQIKQLSTSNYTTLLNQSSKAWDTLVWNEFTINIKSNVPFDQLALRFAQYHLYVMTPIDNRMNIGAKGLSGEGYKGHTFWDTEIFILPYFIFTAPRIARSLLEYRYLSLSGARSKAKLGGYSGAQYPWESAGLSDGEVTPVWGAADIITGKATKIWSGFIEIHITADVVYGVWEYYKATNDIEFMEKYGYEIIFDTAIFWDSRLEWNEELKEYHINDIVGPDEYKEHADNNAFTNYMAHWNVQLAIEYCNKLKQNNIELYNKLNAQLNLAHYLNSWENKISLIYLPKPNENKVLPQDSKYLSLKRIDLTKYKNQTNVGSIFLDYSLDEVNELQVSKQADVLLLFLLHEHLFSLDVKQANWNYYEPLTLHDSSLSLSTHAILAGDMGNLELAYKLFSQACNIDLGPNMKTSDAGIHAASIGGIWQVAILGFAGLRIIGNKLYIRPRLPKHWSEISFTHYWQGEKLNVKIDKTSISIDNLSNSLTLEVYINEDLHIIDKQLTINYIND